MENKYNLFKNRVTNIILKIHENNNNKNNEIKCNEDYSKIINSKIKLSKLSIRYFASLCKIFLFSVNNIL